MLNFASTVTTLPLCRMRSASAAREGPLNAKKSRVVAQALILLRRHSLVRRCAFRCMGLRRLLREEVVVQDLLDGERTVPREAARGKAGLEPGGANGIAVDLRERLRQAAAKARRLAEDGAKLHALVVDSGPRTP